MEKNEEVEDVDSASGDSSFAGSDDEPSVSGQDENLNLEEPLTEKEIEELIAEFLEVESKAAEAQETLEKESLAKVEKDVREELAQTLHGDDLDRAVADEMATFVEEWEAVLDEVETESAHLLEQLDGAGIELPSLYKWIESQAPNGCSTEAWKKRAHWAGSQVTNETAEVIADAEKHLQSQRPVRRKHGKLLEEGASGFLQKKLTSVVCEDPVSDNPIVEWSSFMNICSDGISSEDNTSFGSKHWASVYLASTPQQAAAMGLKFPGVNEVEEIEDVEGDFTNPLIADAIKNEEHILSEEQSKNFRKVKEEDDAIVDRKFQRHLKQRRQRRLKQGTIPKDVCSLDRVMESSTYEPCPSDDDTECFSNKKNSGDGESMFKNENGAGQTSKFDAFECSEASNLAEQQCVTNGVPSEQLEISDFSNSRGSKRLHEDEEPNSDNKKCRTLTEASDDDADLKSVPQETIGCFVEVDSASSPSLHEKFLCTACLKVVTEVQEHPLLKVIVCRDCKCMLEKKLHMKDADCSECFCGWCGQSNELLSCKSCETLFCTTCIRRNLGETCLSKVLASGWKCCCCSPSLLSKLTLELEKAAGSGSLLASSSESGSENSDAEDTINTSNRRKLKKKIRRILDDAELGEETKRKIAIEKERQERLKSMQFISKGTTMSSSTCNGSLPNEASLEVLGDSVSGYIVNVRRETGEAAVRIPPSIAAKLKAHQVAGIRFMWENIVQSITKAKSGDKGLGCILAHTMGLGKTFQVIAFLYTAMRTVDLGLRTALIVTPVNVLHNWRQEFMKWKPSEVKPLRVYMLEDVSRERRAELLAKWKAKGGIFLIGYAAFRNLSLGKHVKDKNMARELASVLQNAPDILVCDEAHIIKNTKADTTQALKQVRCQRRIALTGSPLQNNLMEYYCMVDFVREGFLGSSHEFRNRFQNPIENGQHTNSTIEDVKIMNQRSHILYEQLKGFVQRMDMSVAKKDLPPKTVFVIAVKLSSVQRKLYKRFLDVHGFTKDRDPNEKMRKSFFAGYQALAQIWNHPGILQLRKDDRSTTIRDDETENLLGEDSSSDENMDYNMVTGDKTKNGDDFMRDKNGNGFFQKGWWNDLLREEDYKQPDYSGKMVLLLEIITKCSERDDKTLVFSQSIPTLDLIELYLSRLPRKEKRGKFWKKGEDWYRLDGKTESSERQKLVERFNDPTNKRVKCTLISTRAGSLGINLHAANRVVIVDGSWNPTYDLQAIYRAWRYGQTKPVYAYRLMAHGTMEEKIYKRQVTKEGLAARVVDRQQVHRTISKEEMLHLFEFGDDENFDALTELNQENEIANGNPMNRKVSNGSCSSDKLMDSLLRNHHPSWIANFHEHETLLQENEEEKLSKEEQDMAWEVYQKTLDWKEVERVSLDESAPNQKAPAGAARSNMAVSAPEILKVPKPRGIFRRCMVQQRQCTNLAHTMTLRSQGIKVGCSTVCGECAREISWDDLRKTNKTHNLPR